MDADAMLAEAVAEQEALELSSRWMQYTRHDRHFIGQNVPFTLSTKRDIM
jgi:hypothetical protein